MTNDERKIMIRSTPEYDSFVMRKRNKCLVTNGCFDVFHPGHFSLLKEVHMLSLRNRLLPVVAINSDSSVKTLKGNGRPIIPAHLRAEMIVSLQFPMTVIIFDELTPSHLMNDLQPPYVVKGNEYHESEVIKWKDSKVLFVPMKYGLSTTRIVNNK